MNATVVLEIRNRLKRNTASNSQCTEFQTQFNTTCNNSLTNLTACNSDQLHNFIHEYASKNVIFFLYS